MSRNDILAAIELDHGGCAVVEAAVGWLGDEGGTLHLLHVLTLPPGVDLDVVRNPAAHPTWATDLAETERRAEQAMHALSRGLEFPVQLHLAYGDAPDAILTVARELGAAVLALGTHGRRGFSRALMGSVAEGVVRTSSIPVLVVPTRPHTPPARPVVHRQVRVSDTPGDR